jgi:hypothetical protein
VQAGHLPAQCVWPRFLLRHRSARKALEACFALSPHAKIRWPFVQLCLEQDPDPPRVAECASQLFLDSHQIAYAVRTAVRAGDPGDSLNTPTTALLQAWL